MKFKSENEKLSFLKKSKENNIHVRDIGHVGLQNSIRITIGDDYAMCKIYKMMEDWLNGNI